MIIETAGVTNEELARASSSKSFRDWAAKVANWRDVRAKIMLVGEWNDGVRKLAIEGRGIDPDGTEQHSFFMLCGHTVDVLALLDDGLDIWATLVQQWRMPTGEFVLSNPSGRVEDDGLKLTGIKELDQELGIKPDWCPLVNMIEVLLGVDALADVSPGTSDENVVFYATKARVERSFINELDGKIAGLIHEGERTTLRLARFGELWSFQVRDGRRPDVKPCFRSHFTNSFVHSGSKTSFPSPISSDVASQTALKPLKALRC